MNTRWFWRALVPRSLLSRMLLLLLLAILLSQTILTGIWMQQIQKRELEGMLSTTRNLALSAASTVNFFKSLPLQYRHIALDQLRNMGGSRFFVSLNEEEIHISAIPDSERKTLVLKEVQGVLTRKLSDAWRSRWISRGPKSCTSSTTTPCWRICPPPGPATPCRWSRSIHLCW